VRRLWSAIAVLAAVAAARILLVDSLHDQGYFGKYLIFADRILGGDMPVDRLLDLSPLYLWFTVALRAIGASFTTIRALQIILVSAAAFFAGLAARRWGTLASIAAAGFIIASRGALVCATEIEPETLILVLNSAALAAAMNAMPLASGLLFGFSAACRPNAIVVAIAIAIVLRSWKVILGTFLPVAAVLLLNLALANEFALMDPGTVFYEGMNPNATGYEGVQPRVVNDLERQSREPDFLHVAYRIVASGAAGRPVSRSESNRYWMGKAFAFMRTYPAAPWRLTARKLLFTIHSYEAYDLVTMVRKDFELSGVPIFLPFGVLVGLWSAAARRRLQIAEPWVYVLATSLPMILFYVTARQRNALLPGAAVLAACGLAEIVRRNQALAAAGAAAIAILLSVNGNAQREDFAGWFGIRNMFDEAIAMENAGRWAEADVVLNDLAAYKPIRENRAVSSVAFYRARAARQLGRDPRPFLQQATREAPGNEHVLALRANTGDHRAAAILYHLHDPITARRALAAASR
jgi:hypothetical protein